MLTAQSGKQGKTRHAFDLTQYIHITSCSTPMFGATWTNKDCQNSGNWRNSPFLLAGNTRTLLKVILWRCDIVITEKQYTVNHSALGKVYIWVSPNGHSKLKFFHSSSELLLQSHQAVLRRKFASAPVNSWQLWLRGQLRLAIDI